jgi:hydroxyethylthiazole kinase-like uncharacterized protein yjeF
LSEVGPAEPPGRTARETQVVEANAVARGVSIENLMENAGRAVAEEAARRLPPAPGRVAVMAGTGNNGGDGLAAAFYLSQWGYAPTIWLLKPPADIRSAPARRCYERIASRFPIRVGVPSPQDLRPFPLVVDAMLGTGQSGSLRAPYGEAVRALKESGVPILSIDEPTGLGGPDALTPKWTVALEFRKVGMTPENSGEIITRSIGLPPEAERETGPGDFLFYPVPPVNGRNMRTGRLVIVGGGPYGGAPALAGLSALRAGAERAVILVPAPAAHRVLGYSPNLIVQAVGQDRFRPSDVEGLIDIVGRLQGDAVLVGMGVGPDPETRAAMDAFVKWALDRDRPLIVDADALGALRSATEGGPAAPGPARVATPNHAEYGRHFGPLPGNDLETNLEAVRAEARRRGITILAKDEVDLISDGDRAYLNRHHHPAMTVGGVGDTLAGVLGSLIARGVEATEAARLATFWVGEAGLRAFEEKSWGLLATDVIERIPDALKDGLRRVGR